MERVNQVLEDMLIMYVMDKPSKRKDYLHLFEFSYNNNHQMSLGMSLFEAVYGRKCKTPVSWENPVNRVVIGPKMLKEMEQEVIKIRQKLKVTQDMHKSYIDLKRVHK